MSEPVEPLTADDLADAIVEHLRDYFYGDDPQTESLIAFEPVNPAVVPDFQAERDSFKVFVIPDSESESSFDRCDGVEELLTVGIAVVGPISGNVTRSIAVKFTKQLRIALRGENFYGYGWIGSETDPFFDNDALKKDMFVSAIIASYKGLK